MLVSFRKLCLYMYNLLFLGANGALMYKIHNTNKIREIEHTRINIMVKH